MTVRTFTAFLSYATHSDYALAHRLEALLERLHARATVRKLDLVPLSICVDGSDFKVPKNAAVTTGDDPIRRMLEGYLADSEWLVVLCSRGAAESLRVDQEVDFFLDAGKEDRILCVLTEGHDPIGNPAEIFSPRMIAAGLHLRPWYDLRGWRQRWFRRESRNWKKVRDVDSEVVRLGAHLWERAAQDVYPTWARARDVRRRAMAGGLACLTALAIAAAAWQWYTTTDHYARWQAIRNRPEHVKPTPQRVAVLLKGGAKSQAVKEIDAIEDPVARAEAILKLAEAQVREGRNDAAQESLERVMSIPIAKGSDRYAPDVIVLAAEAGIPTAQIDAFARKFSGDKFAAQRIVVEAGKAFAQRGRFEDVLRIATILEDKAWRAADLIVIAKEFRDPKRAIEILQHAETLVAPDVPHEGFRPDELLRAYVDLGAVQDAIRVANAYQKEAIFGLAAISRHYAMSGDLAKAVEVLKHDSPAAASTALETAVGELLRAGRLDLAGELTSRIPEGDVRVRAAGHVFKALVAANRASEGRKVLEAETARAIEEKTPRNLFAAAWVWSQLGDRARALELFRQIKAVVPDTAHNDTVCAIAFGLAAHGAEDDALAIIEARPAAQRTECRDRVIAALKGGFPAAAVRIAGENSAVAVNVYTAQIAEAAQRGDLELIRTLAQRLPGRPWSRYVGLPEPSHRANALVPAVRNLVKAGRFEDAEAVLAMIDHPEQTSEAQEAIAAGHAARGDVEAAMEWAANVGTAERMSCVFAKVLTELGARRSPPAAIDRVSSVLLERVEQVTTDEARKCAFSALIGTGQLDHAHTVAMRISADADQDQAFLEIVTMLARRKSFRRASEVMQGIKSPLIREQANASIITEGQ